MWDGKILDLFDCRVSYNLVALIWLLLLYLLPCNPPSWRGMGRGCLRVWQQHVPLCDCGYFSTDLQCRRHFIAPIKRSGPSTPRPLYARMRWDGNPVYPALAPALSPSSMRFAGHWLWVSGACVGRKKGLGPYAACKLLYSLAHTHTPLMRGGVSSPTTCYCVPTHYHNVFYLGLPLEIT